MYSSPPGNSPPTTLNDEPQTPARVQSTTCFRDAYDGQPTYAASTASFPQRCSLSLPAQTVPGQIHRATASLCHRVSRDDIPESPLDPIHSVNQQSIPHQMTPQQDHGSSQPDLLKRQRIHGLARPVPRAVGPRYMSLKTRDQTYSIAGTSGVAYAGGASSGPVSMSTAQLRSGSPPKECTLERVRSGSPPSPRESGGGSGRVGRRNTISCDMDDETWELDRRGSVQRDSAQRNTSQQPSPKLEFRPTDSPKYLSLCDPGNHATSYNPDDRELQLAQAAPLPQSPPAPHENVPRTDLLRPKSTSLARLTTQSPTGQSVKNDNHEQDRNQCTPGKDEDGRPVHGHELEVHDPMPLLFSASPHTPLSNLVAADYHGYPHSPHSRPGAPIPPTPLSHTSTRIYLSSQE